SADIRFTMHKVCGLLAVLKDGAFDDEKLRELWICVKESQIRGQRGRNSVQWVACFRDCGVNRFTNAQHPAIDGGKEQSFLAREVPVDRSFSHPKRVCHRL